MLWCGTMKCNHSQEFTCRGETSIHIQNRINLYDISGSVSITDINEWPRLAINSLYHKGKTSSDHSLLSYWVPWIDFTIIPSDRRVLWFQGVILLFESFRRMCSNFAWRRHHFESYLVIWPRARGVTKS